MHTEFMEDLHEAIFNAIDKATAPYGDSNVEDVLPAVLSVLGKLSASVALGFGLNEKAFAAGMVYTFRAVQRLEAEAAALDAIEKAAGKQ